MRTFTYTHTHIYACNTNHSVVVASVCRKRLHREVEGLAQGWQAECSGRGNGVMEREKGLGDVHR